MLRAGAGSLLLFLAAFPVTGPALQAPRTGSVIGTVKGGEPLRALEGARVTLQPLPEGQLLAVVTRARGEFAFHGILPGKYTIGAGAIGFAPMSAEIEVKAQETLEVDFEGAAEGVRLPELSVTETPNLPADFVRRSGDGGGRYLSRAEIERRESSTLGNLLRTFPGLRVDCRRADRARPGNPCQLQLARAPRNCPIAYWIDGMRADVGLVMVQPTRELDGIEIYSGHAETPPELFQPNTCGAIAVWSRTPPKVVKKDKPKPAAAKPDTVNLRK
jgi:hypothetical protein